MILNRLYQLAERQGLLDDPAFESLPVPVVVVVGEGGDLLGIEERRGETITIKKTRKGAEEKRVPDKGNQLSVPRPHGNTASQGFARFFVDTLPRVLPVNFDEKNREKEARSRVTFWRQIDAAADATDDLALRAVQAFGRQLTNKELADAVQKRVSELGPAAGDRVTFAYYPDGGPTLLERSAIRRWYREYFGQSRVAKQERGPTGFCTITGRVGPLPSTHSMLLKGIPGGASYGVSLVSFDKPAFWHYGLNKAENASIGYEAADGYARGFQWLRSQPGHHFTIGGTLFLFWTRRDAQIEFIMALDRAEPEQVESLLRGITKGITGDAIDDSDDFYLLAISGNSARAVIREYLERPLGTVRESIRQWFADLRIADSSKEYQGRAQAAFPLWLLASATALESDRVAPDTHARLMQAALTGGPIPDSVLAACLGRLRAEGGSGFRPARLGLIKLCLNRTHFREGDRMTETLNPDNTHPAYVYGRLLRVFEEIQYAALGDVNATVVDKFYGTFSAAPALVFARLFANAQNHLRKVRGDNEGKFVALDRRLTEVCQLLPPSPPRGTLPLADQGRLALGYYHQKARTFAEIAERKARKAARDETATAPAE